MLKTYEETRIIEARSNVTSGLAWVKQIIFPVAWPKDNAQRFMDKDQCQGQQADCKERKREVYQAERPASNSWAGPVLQMEQPATQVPISQGCLTNRYIDL